MSPAPREVAPVEDVLALWVERNTGYSLRSIHVEADADDEVRVTVTFDDTLGDLDRPGLLRLVADADALTAAARPGQLRIDVPALYADPDITADRLDECQRSDCAKAAAQLVIFAAADRVTQFCAAHVPSSVPLKSLPVG
ncbi:hypothetical protein V9T20_12945 (plasmid) [Halobacterium salinarum]|uniref:hypothetical protein n=1 Tax=Halobacterium salinarum TaxID=2242 RepID=UPI0030CCD00B